MAMGEVAAVVGGGTPATAAPSNFEGGEIPWITPADLSGYKEKYIDRGSRNITELGLNGSSARLLPANTVLFSSRAPIGYVAIASQPMATNQGFKSFVLPEGIDPSYCYFFLLGAKDTIQSLGGGTTFKEISGATAATIPFALPPLPEQRRIVEDIETQFTRLDASVAALKRVQANLKRYRASVLKAACEGKLVPTEAELARSEGRDYEPADQLLERILAERRARWEAQEKRRGKYKEPVGPDTSDLPELPEGWVWATVEQIASVASGQTPKGLAEVVSSEANGVPWYRVADMNTTGNEIFMVAAKVALSKSQVAQFGLHFRPPGTIIFPKRGGAIGTNKKRRLSVDAAYDLNTMGLVPFGAVGDYLWWWFQTIDLASLGDGSNVPQINHDDIQLIAIPFPPLAEQRRIVAEVERRLSVIYQAEATIEANLTRAERLRQSILKQAFSGKLVPQDPNDEPASVLLERIRAERDAAQVAAKNNHNSRRRRAKPTPERRPVLQKRNP